MNQYESILIIDPNVEPQSVEKITEDIQSLISDNGGKVARLENWGKKRLAYEIKGNKDGIYVLLGFDADPAFIQKLQRYYALNEQVIRYLTVRAEKLPKTKAFEVPQRLEEKFPEEEYEIYDEEDYDYGNEGDYSDEDEE